MDTVLVFGIAVFSVTEFAWWSITGYEKLCSRGSCFALQITLFRARSWREATIAVVESSDWCVIQLEELGNKRSRDHSVRSPLPEDVRRGAA